MKRFIALVLTLIMTASILAACGSSNEKFYSVSKQRDALNIKLEDDTDGYSWKYAIEGTDKIRFTSEKEIDGKYIAKFNTVTKSGKGKKSGKAAVAFVYVNDKDDQDILKGYVVNLKMNAKGQLRVGKVVSYKMNPELTTVNGEADAQ